MSENARRDFTVELVRADEKSRTVELSFSSETPVDRGGYLEVLSHEPEAVDLSRLNNGGAVLVNHDPDQQVGVVTKAWIGPDKRGRARVRFGNTDYAKQIFEDVAQGIRRLVSVGYQVLDSIRGTDEATGGKQVIRATKWLPFELSLVAVPADASVGVGRGFHAKTDLRIMSQENDAGAAAAENKGGIEKERTRVSELICIGKLHNCLEEATKAVEDGTPLSEFRKWLLESKLRAQRITSTAPTLATIEAETSGRYSLMRAIRGQLDGQRFTGFEAEVHAEMVRSSGRKPKGIWVPLGSIANRALTATTHAGGGALTSETLLPTLEALRPASRVIELGATTLTNVQPPVSLPRIKTGATAAWVTESQEVPDTSADFDRVNMEVHALACYTAYPKELLLQMSEDLEGIIRKDFASAIGAGLDKGSLQGLGSAAEPQGLFNFNTADTGLNTVTFGAAPSWAKLHEFAKAIETDAADGGPMGWLISPATKAKWAATSRVSGQDGFLLEDGQAAGYPFAVTTHVPSDKCAFGDWSNLIIAMFGGLDVVVDPYTLSRNRSVQITVSLPCDIGFRRAEGLCVSTDSAAQ